MGAAPTKAREVARKAGGDATRQQDLAWLDMRLAATCASDSEQPADVVLAEFPKSALNSPESVFNTEIFRSSLEAENTGKKNERKA